MPGPVERLARLCFRAPVWSGTAAAAGLAAELVAGAFVLIAIWRGWIGAGRLPVTGVALGTAFLGLAWAKVVMVLAGSASAPMPVRSDSRCSGRTKSRSARPSPVTGAAPAGRSGERSARRLASIFLRGPDDRRPLYGGTEKFQSDPHWRDLILFYEYFHGDNGAGIGASHQTGWTGLVARLLQLYADASGEQILEAGRQAPAKIAASLYPGHPRGPGR